LCLWSQAAAAGSLTIVLRQEGLQFTITTQSLLGERTYTYTADGSEYHPPSIDDSPWTTRTIVADNALHDTIETVQGVMTVKRYLTEEDEYRHETMLTTNAGAVVNMTRYFTRVA